MYFPVLDLDLHHSRWLIYQVNHVLGLHVPSIYSYVARDLPLDYRTDV